MDSWASVDGGDQTLKRGAEDDTDHAAKRVNTGQEISLHFQIPNNLVGRLIGKSGATIKALSEKTSARVRLFKDEETDMRATSRRLSLHGPEQEVDAALELLCRTLDEIHVVIPDSSGRDPSIIEMRFAIPKRFVGIVIGRQGVTIAEIKAASGAEVTIHQESATSTAIGSAVVATGRPSQILRVQAEIQRKVRTAAEQAGLVDAIITDANAGTFALEEAAQTLIISCPDAKVGILIGKAGSVYKQLEKSSGARIHIPAKKEVSGFRDISITGNEKQIRNAKESIMLLIGPCSTRPFGTPSYATGYSDPFAQQQMYGNPYQQQQQIGYGQQQQQFGGLNLSQEQQHQLAEYARMMAAGAQVAPGYGQQMQQVQQHIPQAHVPAYGSLAAGETMETIFIPNEKVGLVIGRGGFTLKSVQMQTGVTVNLPKESAPGSNFREMTVKGTPMQIQQFRMTLYEKTSLLL